MLGIVADRPDFSVAIDQVNGGDRSGETFFIPWPGAAVLA